MNLWSRTRNGILMEWMEAHPNKRPDITPVHSWSLLFIVHLCWRESATGVPFSINYWRSKRHWEEACKKMLLSFYFIWGYFSMKVYLVTQLSNSTYCILKASVKLHKRLSLLFYSRSRKCSEMFILHLGLCLHLPAHSDLKRNNTCARVYSFNSIWTI